MAKLYFRYGAMGSAKSMNLLAVAHNYRAQGKAVRILKPATDSRSDTVWSRAGLSASADALEPGARLEPADFAGLDCVLVDEAQFLDPTTVEDLRRVVASGVPVICYGLRTDFRTNLFPGSRRLMELADTIEEVKATCRFCNRKATCNLRLRGGRAVVDGPQVLIGGDDDYAPACWIHHDDATARAATGQAR